MQDDSSPLILPNTYRDSNDIPPTPEGFVLPSTSNIQPMDFNSETRRSIIRPIDSDNSPPPSNSPTRNRNTNKKSIIRQNEVDDEKLSQEQSEQLINRDITNENNFSIRSFWF